MMTETSHRAAINAAIEAEYPGPYSFAAAADCSSPDSPTSPGARWLAQVVDDFAEAHAWNLDHGNDTDWDDLSHEIADRMVPIYTHELWAVFVDLAAYNEDISDYIAEPSRLTDDHFDTMARIALYSIARRLVENVASTVAEALES